MPEHYRHCAIAIGNFDGVHKGHQALIAKLRLEKKHKPGGVLTFSPHPSVLLSPKQEHFALTTDEQKIRLLRNYGVDFVIIQNLSWEFLNHSADFFIDEVLISKLAVSDVIVGDDFRFGSMALGSISDLLKRADAGKYNLHVVNGLFLDTNRASSSLIRSLLRDGKVKEAQRILTRPFSLLGRVSSGQGLGGPLGFATANIAAPKGFSLAHGVYATYTRVYDTAGAVDFLSATNVGTRPTITSSKEVVIETHLIKQKLNLLNKEIEIFFVERLRGEETFSSIEELRVAIDNDCKQIQRLFCLPINF